MRGLYCNGKCSLCVHTCISVAGPVLLDEFVDWYKEQRQMSSWWHPMSQPRNPKTQSSTLQ